MRKSILFLCCLLQILFSFSYEGVCQKDLVEFPNLNAETVLETLYDNGKLSTNNCILWKPNFSEKISFPVSEDGFCHTFLDTVIYYKTSFNTKAVLIFMTYPMVGNEIESYHVSTSSIGLATVTLNDKNVWQLDNFQKTLGKFFSYGLKGKYSVVKLGTDFFAFVVEGNMEGGMGFFDGTTSLYALEGYAGFYSEILKFSYSVEDPGDENGQGGYSEITKMEIISNDKYFPIILSSIKDGSENPIKRSYIFNEKLSKYVAK
jgi:hypothetical protein